MAAGGEVPHNLLVDPLAPGALFGGGMSWEADAGIWTESYMLTPGDHEFWLGGGADDDDSLCGLSSMFNDDDAAAQQQAAGVDGRLGMDQVAVVDALAALDALGMNVDTWATNQVIRDLPPIFAPAGNQVAGGADSSEQQNQVVADHHDSPPPPAPAAGDTQLGPDSLEPSPADEEMEVAEMIRVAARCGEDDGGARTAWSEEEQNELLRCLDLYAEVDDVARCFLIAFQLPKKTALDVALRCRWLQDKKKAVAKQAEPAQKRCAAKKVKKNNNRSAQRKRTKVAKKRKRTYPLSKEALDSKSIKELIEDNYLFLKRIEENLKTGQLDNIAEYFYYVKTNMDAIEKRKSEFGISMTMPPIDEEGLEEILRSHLHLWA